MLQNNQQKSRWAKGWKKMQGMRGFKKKEVDSKIL